MDKINFYLATWAAYLPQRYLRAFEQKYRRKTDILDENYGIQLIPNFIDVDNNEHVLDYLYSLVPYFHGRTVSNVRYLFQLNVKSKIDILFCGLIMNSSMVNTHATFLQKILLSKIFFKIPLETPVYINYDKGLVSKTLNEPSAGSFVLTLSENVKTNSSLTTFINGLP